MTFTTFSATIPGMNFKELSGRLPGLDFKALSETMPYIGKGMLGIFIVTGIIILAVLLLNKLTSPKDKE